MKDKNYILFLSTYPPRACGIATFTQDLVSELQKTGKFKIGIVAISDDDYTYPPEVVHEITFDSVTSYREAADWINHSGASLLVIEHEYGIYGGETGCRILELIRHLKIPYDVTLHTVLPEPKKMQQRIINKLAAGCSHLVTMSPLTVPILQNIYGVNPEKISVIHHGIPEIEVPERTALKKQNGLENRFIISTFGLLNPGKGLEYGIRAVALLVKKHPEILYFILGRTHPVVRAKYGERYRNKLESMVKRYGIQNNVKFINRYLEKEEIIKYIQLSDAYMTPYLGKSQAVSGTLAYAAGYGRVIVSTPYQYAKSMLADGRGLIAEFRNGKSLAACISRILQYPDEKAVMEKKMLEFGREMRWSRVAEKYAALFDQDIQ